MNRTKRMIIIAGVGTALAGGLAVPVAAWATSPTPAPSSSATPGTASDGTEHGPRGGRGGRDGRDGHGEMAAKLAEILGLDKDKVTTALEEVREEGRPGRLLKTPGQAAPQDEARKAALGKQAEALAAKLGLTTDKVAAALETLHRQLGAKAEAALAERLKTAVTGGTLTQAESDAVLKAYRAGLLPGDLRRR
ncbi:hypothetical protein [Streptosporangium sp. NBC_01469]|uniref:hypothetical protein n=1 Tax=Streptosporangium sp. NBC_01469 TaxID=2903898 RepID=UPI002E2BF4A4|nr:hypothetical protein [Streptosporangium sp. NBC_01469]